MDTVIKGFLGVFIFAMIVYLSAGLISGRDGYSCSKELYG